MKNAMLSAIRKAKVDLIKSLVRNFVRYFPRLARSIVNEVNRGSKQELVYAHLVAIADDPVRTLNYLSQVLSFSPTELWRVILLIHQIDNECFDRIVHDRNSLVFRELKLKLTLKRAMFEKTLIQPSCFDQVFAEYLEVLPKAEVPTQLTMMVATLAISRVRIEEVEEVLKRLGLNLGGLTEFQKIKLLSRFDESADRRIFDRFLNEVYGSLSSAGKLKVQLYKGTVLGDEEKSYKKLEDQFCKMRSWLAKEYTVRIKPLYSEIPSSQNFLSARFDKKARTSLQKHIIDHVDYRKSLSYMRLGDGECYGFPDSEYVDEKGVSRQEEHWWGTNLDISLRTRLQEEFVEAVKQADMLGVPTVLRLIRDFKLDQQNEYALNSLICRILCVMRAASEFIGDNLIVEDQSNLYLFDEEFIQDVFRRAKKVVVVTGVDSELIRKWAPDESKLTVLEVPTHRLLRGNELGNSVEGILPNVYERCMEKISTHSGPGVVFLISAGFIGKIFVAEAARGGAVALDIGQSLVGAIRDKGDG